MAGFGSGGASYTLATKVQASGVSKFTRQMGSARGTVSKFSSAMKTAGLALAGVAAGGMAASIKRAASLESAMADVQKVTSKGVADKLKGDLKDLSTQIPIAVGDLAKLAEQAGKFGVKGRDNIRSFVKSVGRISSATDLAADEAGKRFAKIAGAIGLPMSQISKLGNAVNTLADSMKTDAGEITDTANRASNVLSQQFGLGKNAVVSLSASMNEVSSSSRVAAGHLKRAAESLMDPKKATDVAGALGMNVDAFRKMRKTSPEKLLNLVGKRMNKGGEAARTLSSALGTQATRAFSLLGGQLDRTEKAQQRVSEQFKNQTSLQKEMDIRTSTTAGRFQLMKNRLDNIATTIGDAALPYLNKLLDWFSGALDDISKVVGEVDSVRGAFDRLGSFIQGDGGSKITTGIDSMLSKYTEKADRFRTALLGEGGEGGPIHQGITRAGEFMSNEGGTMMLKSAKTMGNSVVEGAKDAVQALVGSDDAILDRAIGAMATFLKSEAVDKMYKATGSLLGKGVRAVFLEIFNLIMWRDDSLIKGLIGDIVDYIKTDAVGDFTEAFSILLDNALSFFTAFYNDLIGKSLIPDMFTEIADYIKNDAASDLLSAAKKAGEAIWNGIKDKFNSLMPDSLSIPGFDVGGQSVGIPNILGGGSVSVPRISSPGFDLDLPKLQTGGLIEDEGLAQLHEGELVVPAAQVDRDVGGGGGKKFVNHGDIEIHTDSDDPEDMADDLLAEVNARF